MDRECNCSILSKVNIKCFYEGKCRIKCLIYETKFSLSDAIYIGNTQQTFRKIMDCNFSHVQRLLKNGQILESFAAHLNVTLNLLHHEQTSVSACRSS